MEKRKQFFNEFMQGVIARLEAEGHAPAAHIHRSALHSFTACMGSAVLLSDFTPQLLKRYETYLFLGKKSRNTISTYLRALRATYNKAVRQGYAGYVPDLFHDVYTGVCAPTKRALAPGEVERVMTAEVPPELKPAQAWFALLFLLRGMPFIDFAHLRKCDYDGRTLAYNRHKTRQPLCVEVLPAARALIDRCADRSGSPYLFPILRGGEEGNYGSALRTLNKHLARLSQYVLPGKHLTSYTARHSWATIAYHLDMPIGVISSALGHTSIRTTEAYLAPLGHVKIDKAHRKVLKAVLGNKTKRVKS